MARPKGAAIEFVEFPSIAIAWDGFNGRYIVKKKGVTQPPAFIAPQNFTWQIQAAPSLKPVGEPFANKSEAILAAAKKYN